MTELPDYIKGTVPEIIVAADGAFGGQASSLETPEKRLMLAVLEDAAASVSRYAGGRTRHEQRVVREIERWYSSEDRRWPFSFVNVCEALGFDSSFLRRAFVRIRASAATRHGSQGPVPRARERAGTRTQVVARFDKRRSAPRERRASLSCAR